MVIGMLFMILILVVDVLFYLVDLDEGGFIIGLYEMRKVKVGWFFVFGEKERGFEVWEIVWISFVFFLL